MKPILTALVAVSLFAQTAQYPGSVASDSHLKVRKNFVVTALAGAISAGDTLLTLRDASRIEANMLLTIDQEVVNVVSVSGNNITVQRGFDNTTAASHRNNAAVVQYPTAWDLNALKEEVKAIQTQLGVGMANVTTAGVALSTRYQWSQTPSGSLSVGANIVTLTPCPSGVAGANVGHNLWISGGTGTAEAVLITGGSCTSGANSGTVVFTAANTHSGNWTIGSATAGIQEAIHASSAGTQITVPSGTHDLLGGTDQLIYIQKNIHLACQGSTLRVASTVSTSTDVVRFRGQLPDGAQMSGCSLVPASGTPARYGINIDATSVSNGSHYIRKLRIENLGTVGPFSDYGIKFTFPTETDGIFNSEFKSLGFIFNGINADRVGDSLTFEGGTILGDHGIRINQLFGAGNLRISQFSIISCAPAIDIVRAEGAIIERNVVEAHPTGGFGLTSSCVQADAQIQVGESMGVVVANNTIVNLPANASQIGANKYSIKLAADSTGAKVHGNTHGLGNYWDYPNVNKQRGVWIASGAADYEVYGDYMKYETDWTYYALNQSPGNGNVSVRHSGYLNIDGPLMIRPQGYDTWKFTSNYLEQVTQLTFATLPASTGKTIITYCLDCNVASPCTGGGTGAWAFSKGGATFVCPF
jgi:hypothetical protein